MIEYVLGFLYDTPRRNVVLIKKRLGLDHHIAGKWNGIGGKIEPTDRNATAAMRREFHEEAALDIREERWTKLAIVSHPHFRMTVFTASTEFVDQVRTVTDEQVSPIEIASVATYPSRFVDHTPFFVELGRSKANIKLPVRINLRERETTDANLYTALVAESKAKAEGGA